MAATRNQPENPVFLAFYEKFDFVMKFLALDFCVTPCDLVKDPIFTRDYAFWGNLNVRRMECAVLKDFRWCVRRDERGENHEKIEKNKNCDGNYCERSCF